MTSALVIYTHPDCGYSNSLKEEMDSLGLEYQEIDLSTHPDEWKTVEELTDGQRITPVSVEDGIVTVGFNGVG